MHRSLMLAGTVFATLPACTEGPNQGTTTSATSSGTATIAGSNGTGGNPTSGSSGGSTSGTCSTTFCNGVCCGEGEQCIQSLCCPSAQSCGSACCAVDSICIASAEGGPGICHQKCTSTGQCLQSESCCVANCDSGGSCLSYCAPMDAGAGECRCLSAADCTTGCCSPRTDDSGFPIGPYICKQIDFQNYDCCNGIGTCSANYCCATDGQLNQFCALPCQNSTDCGPSQCRTYDFSASLCSVTEACGPP
jgi:hypothetical protein